MTEAFFVAYVTPHTTRLYPKNILISKETIEYFRSLPGHVVNDVKNSFYTCKWSLAGQHIVVVCRRTAIDEKTIPTVTMFMSLMNSSVSYQVQFRELQEASYQLEVENIRLIELENTLSSILYHAPMISYSKRADGTYLHTNKMFDDAFGIPPKALRERTDADYFQDQATRDKFKQNDALVLRGEPYQMEETAPHPEGEKTFLSLKFPLRDAINSTFAVAGIAFDITTKKREEQERILLTSEIRASKIVEQFRRNLLMTFSHEIKTPLNAIMLSTDHLISKSTSESQTDTIGIIQQQTSLLNSIINDVLNYERIQNNEPINFTVDEWTLAQVEKIILNTWQSRIATDLVKLMVKYENTGVSIRNDYNHTLQIINYIMSNATKFTQRGNITIKLETRDNTLIIVVEDDGRGVDMNRIDRAINGASTVDFSTIKTETGMGFGLYLTSYFVKQMGGKLSVANRMDAPGTIVSVRLPVELVEKNQQDTQSEMVGFRALSVDDNRINLSVLRRTLERAGVEVMDCQSGQQAVDILQSDQKFDVVFMDWQMPQMDGVEATAIIKSNGYSGPVVMISANILPEDRNMLLDKGFFDVIDKPLTAKKLDRVCRWIKNGITTPRTIRPRMLGACEN